MLDSLRPNDVVVVARLARLARHTSDLLKIVDRIGASAALKRIPETSDLLFLWKNAAPYALSRPGATSFHCPRNPLNSAIAPDGGKTWGQQQQHRAARRVRQRLPCGELRRR